MARQTAVRINAFPRLRLSALATMPNDSLAQVIARHSPTCRLEETLLPCRLNPSSPTAFNHRPKLEKYWHLPTTLEAFLAPVNYESEAANPK
jgi:hypothetical protein